MLHADQLGQDLLAQFITAKRVDHPRAHVVNGEVRSGAGASSRECFDDDSAVLPPQADAPNIVPDEEAWEALTHRAFRGCLPAGPR